jgi:hypothetical protein
MTFNEQAVVVTAYPQEEDRIYALMMTVRCWALDCQVTTMAQLFNTLSPVFTAVGHLTLDYHGSYEWPDEVDQAQWRELLRSFGSVKTLVVDHHLVGELSRSLLIGNTEPPQELLPELEELRVSGRGDGDPSNEFTPFINARQVSGHPVRFVAESESECECSDVDSD